MNNTIHAFFDMDDTLISVKSMFSFQQFWFSRFPNAAAEKRFHDDMALRHHKDASWEDLNRLYYSHFEGRRVDEVFACAVQWFQHCRANNQHFFHTAIVNILRSHQDRGHHVVLVSGSFPAVIAPVADALGVSQIFSTCLEEREGHYTGNLIGEPAIGEGKAVLIQTYAQQNGITLSDCYAYGDDISDAPMLNCVGHPQVVSGGRGLEALARERGWPVLAP